MKQAASAKGKQVGTKALKGAAKAVGKAARKGAGLAAKKAILACALSGVCLAVAGFTIAILAAVTVTMAALPFVDEEDLALVDAEDLNNIDLGGSGSGVSVGGGGGGAITPGGVAVSVDDDETAARQEVALQPVVEYWRLHSRQRIQPITLLNSWVLGAVDDPGTYTMTTGATMEEACENLLDGYENDPDMPSADTLLESAKDEDWDCQPWWAAAVAWQASVQEVANKDIKEQNPSAEFPIREALRTSGEMFPWQPVPEPDPDLPSDEQGRIVLHDADLPGALAGALWRGSGFGTEDETDGFAAVFYNETDKHDAPYCGLASFLEGDIEDEDYDDKVLVPVPCPEPPTLDICSGLTVLGTRLIDFEERALTGIALGIPGVLTEGAPDVDPDAPISSVPYCERATEAEVLEWEKYNDCRKARYDPDHIPEHSCDEYQRWWEDNWSLNVLQWHEQWWRGEITPEEEAHKCGRTAAGVETELGTEKWTLTFCAHRQWRKAVRVCCNADGGLFGYYVYATERSQVVALWGWAPEPPEPPDFGPILGRLLNYRINQSVNVPARSAPSPPPKCMDGGPSTCRMPKKSS